MLIDNNKQIKDYKKLNSSASQIEKEHGRNSGQKKTAVNGNNTLLFMVSYMLLIGIIVVFGILYINKYVEMNKLNLQMSQVEKEIQTLKAERQKLKLRISQYKSLDRIERIAKNELGMVNADEVTYISMNQADNSSTPIENRQSFSPLDKILKLRKLGYKISTWFKGLSQVEAGTLDK